MAISEFQLKLENIFNKDYPGTDILLNEVIKPMFGENIDLKNNNLSNKAEYADKAKQAGLKQIIHIADISEQNLNANNIVLLDVTIDDSVNIERSRVNIQRVIRSIMAKHQHLLIIFHYEDFSDKQWRFSYAYKGLTSKDDTSPKRYTYVFGKGYRGRTAAERFVDLKNSKKEDKDFEKAFSVAALSDEFFNKYRDIYADFVQFITGKRYEKIKNKWEEVKKRDPNTEILSQFKNDDKRVRDYIKKMLGRLTFLCFLQRKGWMNNDPNFLQNLYQKSALQDDFLDAVLEPLFFGVLNTPPENRKEIFIENGWNTDLVDEWKEIPYLNGGLFEQTREDKLAVRFDKSLFQELFKFLDEYNFTIDENDPDDAEIGIDPEMLGRVFESLLEDNKDKGAFYTPKEIVQYMCRQSIIEYLKTHTDQSLHADIEDLINNGLVNRALQNKDNARAINKLLKEVTVCDPAIGSGAFPMGILNILFTARQHLYGFLKESEPFNPLEVKKSIIRDNIYGVDIEQGAVDIARLRFWLAILVEEQVATPLPNLDYRIVRGNSLIPTFNDQYIQLPENPDGRTKIAKLKKELHQLQNELFNLNGEEKLKCEIDIKRKILEIIKVQLDVDNQSAQRSNSFKGDLLTNRKISSKTAKQLDANNTFNCESFSSLYILPQILTTSATPLADRAQIDIKFFDWKIVFSNIFNEDSTNCGFDIVIGNPPYIEFKNYPKSEKDKLTHYTTTKGKFDIYIPFIEMGAGLLKKAGLLTFICPTRFLKRDYGKALRNFILSNLKINTMIDFADYQIFDNAMTYTGIVIFQNITEKNAYNFRYSNHLDEKYQMVDSLKLHNDIWDFSSGETSDLLLKIQQKGKTLSEISDGIIQGIATGKDSVFLIKDDIITRYQIEKEMLRPFLKGKDISAYKIDWSGYYVIYPYDSDGKVFQEDDLKTKYPNTYRYLQYKRDELKGRGYFDKSSKLWFELWNQRKSSRFEGVKIVTLDNASKNSFTIDENNFYGTTTVYNIKIQAVNVSPYYVVGILNSKLLDFYHKSRTVPQSNGFYRYQALFIKDLPIIVGEKSMQQEIETIVKSIIADNTNNSDALVQRLDNIIYHLYDLTYDEVLIIDPQTPIPREEYDNPTIK